MKRALAIAIPVALLLGCGGGDREPAAPTGPAALQADAGGPQGFIQEPRIAEYNPNTTAPNDRSSATAANLDKDFTFKGWVDFPPDQGELLVYVDDDGDSYPGNGSTLVRTAPPSSTTRTVDGRTVWTFSIGPFKPFREVVNAKSFARPWPDGGTGRISLYAHRLSDDARTLLRGVDRSGVKGAEFGPSLVFADVNATPVNQSSYSTPLYPVPDYLGKRNKTGTRAETDNYYNNVYVADDDRHPEDYTIAGRLFTLDNFRGQYFGQSCPSPGNLVVDASPAIYFNKGDLGIGREMHCSYNACTQETACYVKNYGNPNGSPFFSAHMDQAKQAIDANKPFATVAMVSRGKIAAGVPNKVFFAVYGADGRLVNEAPLDNRKYNTFIPGNCLVCHGAAASYTTPPSGFGLRVLGAQFLPFDLQHGLAYFSTASSDPLSRAAQETKFRTLNRIVATTDLYTLPDAKALLDGFYGGSDPSTWGPTFRDNWVPPNDWNASPGTRQLYKQVIAGYCRTCHISDTSLDFGNYSDFVSRQFAIQKAVCGGTRDKEIMPNAEVTSNAFWQSGARVHLVQRANFPGCGLLGPDATE